MTQDVERLYSEMFAAASVGRAVGEMIAAREGQTQTRWQTMWTIEAAGALSVPQIARRLGTSRQNEQRVVRELVDAGLAEFAPNPDHKTSPLARLTPRGAEVLASINGAAATCNQQILDRMGDSQVDRLTELLRQFSSVAHGLLDSS